MFVLFCYRKQEEQIRKRRGRNASETPWPGFLTSIGDRDKKRGLEVRDH